FDFAMLDRDGSPFPSASQLRYLLGKVPVNDSYAWAQPVLAPVSGVVVEACDGWMDRPKLNFFLDYITAHFFPPHLRDGDLRPLTGNYLILEGEAEFLLLAHLRCGSLKVRTGQPVLAGDQIAEIGNSGNSTLSHLHIQAMDDGDPRTAKG